MTDSVAEIKLIRFDWAIKTLLRNKANFDVLEGFLSALLNEAIIIEQILESESNAEEGRKFNRVDMLVHDSQGRKLIIEVQNERETDYLERLLFGTAKVIIDNMPLGEAYRQIVKVISISIIYFNLGVGDDYVYKGTTEFQGIHTEDFLKLRKRTTTDAGRFFYREKNIFPEYYLINVERFGDIIQNSLDEWIYFFKHSAVRANFSAPHIDKAMHKLTLLNMTPKERRSYEDYVKSLVIERDVIETAIQDGLKIGIEKGRQEGRQEGAAQLLLKLLHLRFGEVPTWVQQRLAAAETAQIETWVERVLTATNIETVFE